ncbi:TMV resistance protein N [Vitis vinifera]|uniref:TMV resistance protein N n=1 Tax=Vitis vinifera TaxID=29760 RepID=A0A438HWT8_VITVI|nr:TMV resistance protein N [Vitis vinifera]
MASSGTSSFQWRWDVFLSFRGEDARLNFTDHLYSALRTKGINTFRDDEGLERGGEIQPSLLKAIEDSMISVVVFSENYAHSKWCLIRSCSAAEKSAKKFYQFSTMWIRLMCGNKREVLEKHLQDTETSLRRGCRDGGRH